MGYWVNGIAMSEKEFKVALFKACEKDVLMRNNHLSSKQAIMNTKAMVSMTIQDLTDVPNDTIVVSDTHFCISSKNMKQKMVRNVQNFSKLIKSRKGLE